MLKLFARRPADAKAELKEVFDGYILPTFPTVYLEALQLVRDTDSSCRPFQRSILRRSSWCAIPTLRQLPWRTSSHQIQV